MNKYPLIGGSICAVVLIVLASYTNVVSVQTVELSNHKIIKDEINQKELLFQTILDIANNKEIHKIIQNSEMKGVLERSQLAFGSKLFLFNLRSYFSALLTQSPVLTKKYLDYTYRMGVILSRTLEASKIHSLLERYQVSNQGMQKELSTVVQKDAILKSEIAQLSSLSCDCENEKTTTWTFPVLCTILYILELFFLFLAVLFLPIAFLWILFFILFVSVNALGSLFNCWPPLPPFWPG
jgi:hypothetical protein